MEKIYAPWRMEYVGGDHRSTECIFCLAAKREKDFVLSVSTHTVVLLNKYPYTTGHLMVAPVQHQPDLATLDDDSLWHLARTIRACETILRDEYRPQGLNIGINLGDCAGAGFPGHVHVHLVPRWVGDTNFMPAIGDVRVVPEALERTFERLKPYFEEL